MEQSFGDVSEELPSGPSAVSARPKTSRATWVVRTAVVLVGALAIALAGAATVGEFVPSERDVAREASITQDDAVDDAAEPASQTQPTEEPEGEAADSDESDESPNAQDDAVGTFTPADPAAAPAPDSTPPPTPSQLGPPNNETHDANSTVVLTWEAVDDPSGVTYGVELQRYDPDAGRYVAWKTIPGLTAPSLSYHSGDTAERWRVWATDGAENSSAKSGWWTIMKPIFIVPGYEIYEPPTIY